MGDRSSAEFQLTYPGRKASLYIALTPVLAIFVLIPLELYTTAAEYWRWNPRFPLRFVICGSLIYLILAALLVVIGNVSQRLMARSALFIFYLGLFVLLADVLAPLQTGLLDGSPLESDEPLSYTLIEVGLLGFVLFLARKLGANTPRVAVLMTTLLLITALGYSLYAFTLRAQISSELPNRAAATDVRSNVYHIVLDEMQTDAAMALLKDQKLASAFEGFTFYRNNISNYLFTNVSMPSYLTGKLYKSGNFLEWQDSYKNSGLFRRMYDAGYDLQLYSVYDHWCSPYARQCLSLDQIFEEETGLLGTEFVTFIQIWFARISPNAVTNWALARGKNLGNVVDERLNATDDDIPKTIARGRAPYSSVLMLDRLIREEEGLGTEARYVYAHTIIPHGPYVMNAECEYDAALWKSAGGQRAYYEQAACALNKVAEFLAELKRLDRYNDAAIVVHADTGHGHMGFLDFDDQGQLLERASYDSPVLQLDDKFRKSEEWYLARSMALMMIKPPLAKGNMDVSEDFSHLTDIYPTLLNFTELSIQGEEDLHGIALPVNEVGPQRPANIFFTTPVRPGDITTLTISDQSDIRHAQLATEVADIQVGEGRFGMTLGLDDGLGLQGFSYPEHSPDGSSHWRWALGTEASIDFSSRLALSPGEYIVELELAPFAGNIGALAIVSFGGQSRELLMKDVWEQYRLAFDLKGDEVPVLQLKFESAVSPETLGISADQRQLAARISRVEIRPAVQ